MSYIKVSVRVLNYAGWVGWIGTLGGVHGKPANGLSVCRLRQCYGLYTRENIGGGGGGGGGEGGQLGADKGRVVAGVGVPCRALLTL